MSEKKMEIRKKKEKKEEWVRSTILSVLTEDDMTVFS